MTQRRYQCKHWGVRVTDNTPCPVCSKCRWRGYDVGGWWAALVEEADWYSAYQNHAPMEYPCDTCTKPAKEESNKGGRTNFTWDTCMIECSEFDEYAKIISKMPCEECRLRFPCTKCNIFEEKRGGVSDD